MIRNDNDQTTHRRGGSPAPQEREQALDNSGELKDSLRGDQRKELAAQEYGPGSQSDDQRWQARPPTSFGRDDGGESGEVV